MKCSLGIFNFLDELSSLFLSIVFLYFFALIIEEGFLISPCYSLEFCIPMGISYLLYFLILFSLAQRALELVTATMIKRCLLLRRKAMTNLDSILKSRDINLPTKVHLIKAMVFPVVM